MGEDMDSAQSSSMPEEIRVSVKVFTKKGRLPLWHMMLRDHDTENSCDQDPKIKPLEGSGIPNLRRCPLNSEGMVLVLTLMILTLITAMVVEFAYGYIPPHQHSIIGGTRKGSPLLRNQVSQWR